MLGLISATSAPFTFHEKRIKIAKGAEPAGGRRSEVEDQTSPTDPIKGRAERQQWEKVEVGVRGGARLQSGVG